MGEWISVEDRLPEAFGSYQVFAPDLFDDPEMKGSEPQAIVSWTEYGWSYYEEIITHWMPLPSPPESG